MEKDFLGPEQKKLKQQTCRVYVSADWLIPSEKSVCVCVCVCVCTYVCICKPVISDALKNIVCKSVVHFA